VSRTMMTPLSEGLHSAAEKLCLFLYTDVHLGLVDNRFCLAMSNRSIHKCYPIMDKHL
jgi:hypothetical protein